MLVSSIGLDNVKAPRPPLLTGRCEVSYILHFATGLALTLLHLMSDCGRELETLCDDADLCSGKTFQLFTISGTKDEMFGRLN